MDRHFNVFYEGLKDYDNASMQYFYVYLMRRYCFLLMVFYLPNYPAFQLMLWNFLNLVQVSYLLHAKPFEEPGVNKIELFNEFVIFFLSYLFLCFSDWVSDPALKTKVGAFFIYVIFFNVFVNLSNIIY